MARAVIAGVGHTAFGALPGHSPVSLNVEAVRLALENAGIEKSLVDAVFVKHPTSRPEMLFNLKVMEALGIQPKIGGGLDLGGAANIAMISYAALAIEAGQADVAVVCFADNPKTGSAEIFSKGRDDEAVFGAFGTLPNYGMIARAHMETYGTTQDQLGAVAVNARKLGAANPNAQLRKALTIEEYRASKPVVDPLKREDCALISDGGAAVVVMSEARAKELKMVAPVPILGYGQGHTAWEVALRPDLTSTGAVNAGATAFKMAGLAPKDIDVAQIYDCFTIVPIMTLEDYGFCKKGAGGRFIEEGSLPMNTSGGLLSETGMPGLQLIIEGVRQMRGVSVNQVKGAKKTIISNQGGIMQTHATLILGQP